jgi:hypothetical protein
MHKYVFVQAFSFLFLEKGVFAVRFAFFSAAQPRHGYAVARRAIMDGSFAL